jgi:DNA-binding transcriptional MocR family regulator
MIIQINKADKTPYYLQISLAIKKKILEGEFLDGFVLPSERELAKVIGVHRNTVTKAYNELKSEGLVGSVHGVGYRVQYGINGAAAAKTDKPLQEGAAPGQKPPKQKGVHWESMIKDEYLNLESAFDDLYSKSYDTGSISFAGGISSPTVYLKKDISTSIHHMLSHSQGMSYFHTPYAGDLTLRKHLASFLHGKGIDADPTGIQVFSEMNQALDFLITLMLRPGDTVITEEPLSPDVYRTIKLAGGKIISVPVDEEGMICDHLAPLIEKHRPRFIYVNSSYQDPTGTTMSLARRQTLLDLSYKYRVPLIEEDAASDLGYGRVNPPRLKAMDRGSNVIYIFSFSLTFVPGVGIAFVAGPKTLIDSLANLVSVRLVSLDWLSQKLLAQTFETHLYYDKLAVFQDEYRKKMDRMCAWLDRMKSLGVTYRKPDGGVYVWCKMPETMDMKRFFRDMEHQGVAFVPGNVFYPDKNRSGSHIRLNFSYPSPDQIDRGMKLIYDYILAHQKTL